MKNLKSLAATFNLYQLNDIPDTHKNYNFEHAINYGKRNIPEFMLSFKGAEVGLFYECKQDTNYQNTTTYYVEHSYILVKAVNSDIVLMLKSDRHNKYNFHPYYSLMHKYQNIAYSIREKGIKELKRPNDIGVFTEKKVNDWLQYCEDYIKALDNVYNEVTGKNNEIQTEIHNFIASIPGCKFSTYQNITDIDTPLFRVRFTHYKDQNYVNKEITFKGGLSAITKIENSHQLVNS